MLNHRFHNKFFNNNYFVTERVITKIINRMIGLIKLKCDNCIIKTVLHYSNLHEIFTLIFNFFLNVSFKTSFNYL